MAGNTFYQQQSANRRNSLLMAGFIVLLLGLLGFSIGYAIFGTPAGGAATTLFAVALGVHVRDRDLLQRRQARPGGQRCPRRGSGPGAATHERHHRAVLSPPNIPVPRCTTSTTRRRMPSRPAAIRRHASIAITTGLLEKLDREELQGVIGHELSHVRNLDIRFSLVVAVMVGAIALLADFFLRFTFWGGTRRSRNNDGGGGGGAQAAFAIVAIVLAILAPIISRFIQLAVSRQREYLADASSVELTRNPSGLERALAKISSDREVLEVANRGTQHLYFTNPIKKFEARSSSLTSTHPAILDRINRLRELTNQPALSPEEAAMLADLE